MKTRPQGFLSEENIDHDSEPFKYIQELHEYLWGFVRTFLPSASGNLSDFVDSAIMKSYEYADLARIRAERDEALEKLGAANLALILLSQSGKIELPESFIETIQENRKFLAKVTK